MTKKRSPFEQQDIEATQGRFVRQSDGDDAVIGEVQVKSLRKSSGRIPHYNLMIGVSENAMGKSRNLHQKTTS